MPTCSVPINNATLAHAAATGRGPYSVDELLQQPWPANVLHRAMMEAAKAGRSDALRSLLQHGASPDAVLVASPDDPPDGLFHEADCYCGGRCRNHALLLASHHGHLESAECLLTHSPPPEGQARHFWIDRLCPAIGILAAHTALGRAAARGHPEIVRLLLEHGASVMAGHQTPLKMAHAALESVQADYFPELGHTEEKYAPSSAQVHACIRLIEPKVRWAAVRDSVRIRPYVLHWMEDTARRLCAPGARVALQDQRAFLAEFGRITVE
jgi:hypothetical protein